MDGVKSIQLRVTLFKQKLVQADKTFVNVAYLRKYSKRDALGDSATVHPNESKLRVSELANLMYTRSE